MAELTIGEARNRFSSLIADIVSGRATEHVIKKRDVVVAKIVPADVAEPATRPFGMFRDDPLLMDDDIFDELDAEIADEFGV